MIGNIVVFTDYYIHSLENIVEESSLTVGLYCVSDYNECLELVQTLPNLLGVLVIDWKPIKRTLKFFRELIKICDHIAECAEKPMTITYLYRVESSAKVFKSLRSKNLYVYSLKLTSLTDEIIKLDGISPIISDSQGVFGKEESHAINPSRAEFDSDYFNTVVFALLDSSYEITYDMLERHPLLRSIQNYRNGDLGEDELRKLLDHTPFSYMFKQR